MKFLNKFSFLALVLATGVQANQNKDPVPADVVPYTDEAQATDLTDEEMKELAFEIFLERNFKMTPEQLRQYAEKKRSEAEALKRQKPADSIRKVDALDISPAAKPYRIYITPGWDTHVSFIDAAGNVWPVMYQTTGSSEEFNVVQVISETSNKLRVNGKFRVGSSNLTVGLKGIDELITLELMADKQKYHSSLTLQIPQLGPNTSSDITSDNNQAMMSNEPYMQKVLHGGVGLSNDFKKLQSSHQDVSAWQRGNLLYILTNLHVHGVDPLSVRHGPGGYTAYEISYLPSLLFTTDNGNAVSVYFQKERGSYAQ